MPAFVTFLACLFVGVEMGILIGTIFDLAVLIYLNARPTINIEHRNVRERKLRSRSSKYSRLLGERFFFLIGKLQRIKNLLLADLDDELLLGPPQRRDPVSRGGSSEDVPDEESRHKRRAGLRAHRQDRLHCRTGLGTVAKFIYTLQNF